MGKQPAPVKFIMITEEELRTIVAEEVQKAVDKALHREAIPDSEQEYLSQTEAMQLLGVTRPTIHRWTQQGLIKSMKISRTVRYLRSDLIKLQHSKEEKNNNN